MGLIPWRETSLSGFRSEQFVRPFTQGPRHNFLRCLRARDFFQLTLFKVFTSSPTFFQQSFRDPASAGSVPGAPGVTPRLFATRLQPGACRVVPLRWPASQRSAGACEQVYRAPNPAGNAHGVRCESPNVACAIHITRGRIAGPFCLAPALSRGSAELLSSLKIVVERTFVRF